MLGSVVIEDVLGQMDIQYPTGLKKFFTVYIDTVRNTAPAVIATPKLASLLHTSQLSSSTIQRAGTRHMHVQPTAISRIRGVTKGSGMAPSCRPPKRPLTDCDVNVQIKRERKQNLGLNKLLKPSQTW